MPVSFPEITPELTVPGDSAIPCSSKGAESPSLVPVTPPYCTDGLGDPLVAAYFADFASMSFEELKKPVPIPSPREGVQSGSLRLDASFLCQIPPHLYLPLEPLPWVEQSLRGLFREMACIQESLGGPAQITAGSRFLPEIEASIKFRLGLPDESNSLELLAQILRSIKNEQLTGPRWRLVLDENEVVWLHAGLIDRRTKQKSK